eukprot:scaffold13117_cov107-Skeletonema_dohrnii-CCMP3373.AAC.3
MSNHSAAIRSGGLNSTTFRENARKETQRSKEITQADKGRFPIRKNGGWAGKSRLIAPTRRAGTKLVISSSAL